MFILPLRWFARNYRYLCVKAMYQHTLNLRSRVRRMDVTAVKRQDTAEAMSSYMSGVSGVPARRQTARSFFVESEEALLGATLKECRIVGGSHVSS